MSRRSVVTLGVTTLAVCAAVLPGRADGATLAARAGGPTLAAHARGAAVSEGATARAGISAQAASVESRWVCHGPALVFDTPGGIVIGILARGDHVGVLLHSAAQPRWVLVRGPIAIRGWMNDWSLC
jgi:hypothetical protein